jgi:poly(ADP-ribose) glycohydrolase
MFLIYPQLHVSILVCERMEDFESIYIRNLRRYADYTGYGKTLALGSPAADIFTSERKDFFAIDALKYTSKDSNEDDLKRTQYRMKNVLRDLNKALIGFTLPADTKFSLISTGKWGCGAFGGDPQLKFLQQWMAISVLGRPMIFNTFKDNDSLEDLPEITTRYLNGKTVGQLYRYIKHYSRGDSEHKIFMSIMH